VLQEPARKKVVQQSAMKEWEQHFYHGNHNAPHHLHAMTDPKRGRGDGS
jgi:hypothetical protein